MHDDMDDMVVTGRLAMDAAHDEFVNRAGEFLGRVLPPSEELSDWQRLSLLRFARKQLWLEEGWQRDIDCVLAA